MMKMTLPPPLAALSLVKVLCLTWVSSEVTAAVPIQASVSPGFRIFLAEAPNAQYTVKIFNNRFFAGDYSGNKCWLADTDGHVVKVGSESSTRSVSVDSLSNSGDVKGYVYDAQSWLARPSGTTEIIFPASIPWETNPANGAVWTQMAEDGSYFGYTGGFNTTIQASVFRGKYGEQKIRLGFAGEEFTLKTGYPQRQYEYSRLLGIGPSGHAFGASFRHPPNSSNLEPVFWISSPSGVSVRITGLKNGPGLIGQTSLAMDINGNALVCEGSDYAYKICTPSGDIHPIAIPPAYPPQAHTMNREGYIGGSVSPSKGGFAYGASTNGQYHVFGFQDSEHTGPGGKRESSVSHWTSSGQFGGVSQRYASTDSPGSNELSAWTGNLTAGATTRVGLLGPDFISSTGKMYSYISCLAEDGWCSGVSISYKNYTRKCAWIAEADGSTTQIGLQDSIHLNSEVSLYVHGGEAGKAYLKSGADWVAGYSTKATGGETAWVYCRSSKITHIVTPISPAASYYSATIQFLSQKGYALGYYEPAPGGSRKAFIWDVANGFRDLASALGTPGMAALNSSALYETSFLTSTGMAILPGRCESSGLPGLFTIRIDLPSDIPSLQIRTDMNGDGAISYSNESDVSSYQNPFRFWLNDDRDTGSSEAAEDINEGNVDSDADFIDCTRDLEDFALINVQIPDSVYKSFGLNAKINFSASGSGKIKIRQASKNDFSHLTDPGYASALVLLQTRLQSLTPGGRLSFDLAPLSSQSSTSNTHTLSFLFEGVESTTIGSNFAIEGSVTNQFGTECAHIEPFYVDLKPVKNYYDHFTVGTTSTPAIQIFPAPRIVTSDGYQDLNLDLLSKGIYANLTQDSPYLLFTHGWRMEPWMRIRFAETAYKRLYWAGYRGGFGLFSWPTEYTDFFRSFTITDAENYDRSEYQAWRSAAGMRTTLDFLESGSAPRVRLIAHSMGNVVASEALRMGIDQSSSPIYSYIASQAATSSQSYDIHLDRRPAPFELGNMPNKHRGYFSGIAGKTSNGIYNFCNPLDYALNVWLNSQSYKPDSWGVPFGPSHYYFFNESLLRFEKADSLLGPWSSFDESTRYEEFSFAAPSAGRALGAEPLAAGEVTQLVRLDAGPFFFTSAREDHSGQFRSSIHYRRTYWIAVLSACGLGAMPVPPSGTESTSFQRWAQAWLGSTNSSFDPYLSLSNDGIPSLHKYAFGQNPLLATHTSALVFALDDNEETLPQGAATAINLECWCNLNALDLSFVIEYSDDLTEWVESHGTRFLKREENGLTLVRWTLDPAGATTRFYRIRVLYLP